ncbi:ATP-binding cassette domain-containing protein, partial [Pseudomonas aeruginosa]
EAAELALHAGQKAGLTGANGDGKSSLFALLRGQRGQDAGDCLLPADGRIAHMRQEVVTLDRLAVDYVLDRLYRPCTGAQAADAEPGQQLARPGIGGITTCVVQLG